MPYRVHCMVCAGTGCVSNRSLEVRDALENEIRKRGLQDEIQIVTTGCNGFCAVGPLMVVQPDGIFYQQVSAKDVPLLVEEHFIKGRPVQKLLYKPPEAAAPIPKMSDIPFFKHQRLIALRNRGLIDPEKIEDYIARDGYQALVKALTEMTPQQIIEVITKSGLRGRGGAGFPTGVKWQKGPAGQGRAQIHHLQRRRGRPGRLHGPLHLRIRPALGHRRHAHRSPRHRRALRRGVHPQ
jgi:(2Fe-2S) ferredoxin